MIMEHSDGTQTTLESILRMTSGDGPNSYAANSYYQRDVMLKVRSILQESVKRVYSKTLSDHFTVADLGCASGPNSLEAATAIVEAITGLCHQSEKSTPEMLIFLNDLLGNDFNSVFMSLQAFYQGVKKDNAKSFVSAMPGSFHGRLFPSRSLQFVHSSMSVHWLSQVPNGLEHNKGRISMASNSPDSVLEAYMKQFQRDFTVFLRSRAEEMIPQGEMVLTFVCRTKWDVREKEHAIYYWELLANCLIDMAAEGVADEKAIDSFNLPFYTPHEDEVRDLLKKEASFAIDKLEIIEQTIGPFHAGDEDRKLATAKMIASTTRSLVETLLTSHFGGGLVMDDLFQRHERKLDEYLSSEMPTWAFFVLSATKI